MGKHTPPKTMNKEGTIGAPVRHPINFEHPDFLDEKKLDGHKVSVGLLDHGVYAKETHHTTVRLAPALTITSDQIDQLSDAVTKVVASL